MAYTYTGTPTQRIQQAQQRISDESVATNPALSSYLAALEKQQTVQVAEPQKEKKWYERLGDTLGMVAKDVFTGFTKAFEGIADFGASTVGVFAGLAGNNELKKNLTAFTARDLAGTEMWDSMRNAGLNVDFESSWINDLSPTGQNILRGVGQGVGQMLPMIALTAATGGTAGALGASAKTLGTVGKVTRAANLAGLGMSAAGSATENALNQELYDENGNKIEVDLDRAYLYGLASGAMEVATEKLVGGVFEKATGTGLADKLINRMAKSTKFEKAVKFALDTVGEGAEEMVSEAFDGTLRKIYDENADTRPDVEAVFEAGVIGSLTAMALGGGQAAVRKASNVQTVQDTMLDIENIDKRADSLEKSGKLTEEKLAKLEADRNAKVETISKRYARANAKTQAKMRNTMPWLSDVLNEDGTVRQTALDEGATEIKTSQAGAMSGSLAVSRRAEVANRLKKQNLSISENITEDERKGAKWLSNALDLTGKESGVKAKYVLVDGLEESAPAFIDGDVVYVNRKTLTDTVDESGKVIESKDEKVARAFVHEVFHFAEGSNEYNAVMTALNSVGANKSAVNEMRVKLDNGKTVAEAYNLPAELIDAIEKGETDLSRFKESDVRKAKSEINAKTAESVLGNKQFIDRLVEDDRSTAKKLLHRVQDAIKKVDAYIKGDKETVASLKLMRTCEKMFSDALATSGQAYLYGKRSAQKAEAQPQFTISKAKGGASVVVIDNDILNGVSKKNWITTVVNTLRSFKPGIPVSGRLIKVNAQTTNEYVNSDNTTFYKGYEGQIYKDKLNASQNIDEIVLASTNYVNEDLNHKRKDNIVEFARGDVKLQIGGRKYSAKVVVGFTSGNSMVLYDVVDFQTASFELKKDTPEVVANLENGVSSNTSILNSTEKSTQEIQKSIRPVMTKKERLDSLDKKTREVYDKIVDSNYTYFPTFKELSQLPAIIKNQKLAESIKRTYSDNSESRVKLRKDVAARYFEELKSAERDEDGEIRYNGKVEKGKTVVLVLGRAASGKSALVNAYSNKYKARVLDNDEVKQMLPEYGMGEGADAVHQESSEILDNLIIKEQILSKDSRHYQENVVIATVGKKTKTVRRYIDDFKAQGYTVYVAHNELPVKNCLQRGFTRFCETGRLVPFDYINKLTAEYNQNPQDHYFEILNEEGYIDGYANYSNDVEYGNNPEGIGTGKEIQLLARDFETVRRTRGRSSGSETASGSVLREGRESSETDARGNNENDYRLTQDSDIRFSRRGSTKQTDFLKDLDGMQLDSFGRAYATVKNASKFFEGDERAKRLLSQMEQMSTMDEGVQTKYAHDVAKATIRNMVATDVEPEYLDGLMSDARKVLNYRKKLNLKPIQGEIEYAKGKDVAKGIMLQWQALKGETGLSVDQIVEELREQGVLIKSEVPADIFLEMLDVVDKARSESEKVLNKHVDEILSAEEYDALENEIADDFMAFMQENGEDATWKGTQGKIKSMIADAEQRSADILKLATLKAQQIEERAAMNMSDYKKQLALEEQQFEEKTRREFDLQMSLAKADMITDVLEAQTEVVKAHSDAADAIQYNVEYHNEIEKTWSEVISLSKIERTKYKNASVLFNESLEGAINKLAGIKYRGNLKKFGTRKIVADFGNFYNLGNQLLNGGLTLEEAQKAYSAEGTTNIGYLDKGVLDSISFLESQVKRPIKSGKNKGEMTENRNSLTFPELQAVRIVLAGARHVLDTYNKVQIGEKFSVLSEVAKDAQVKAEQASGRLSHEHKLPNSVKTFINNIITPQDLISKMFGYRDNSMSELYQQILDGAAKAKLAKMEMDKVISDFMKENKSYKKRLEKDTVKINGEEIPLQTAITLFMMSRQSETWAGFTNGGWGYKNASGYWKDCGKLTLDDIDTMASVFEKADIDFMKTLRKFFDLSTKFMIEADKTLKGYSTIEILARTDYFPIKRYAGDRAAVAEDTPDMNVSVASLGITKDRVANSNRLDIMPILDVLSKHARDVGMYYGLGMPIKEFERVYNCNVSEEKNGIKTIRNTINEKSWDGFNTYMQNLLKDIQGIARGDRGKGSEIVGKMRGAYIKSILGFNLKTILSQTAGFPAAFTILQASSMSKAFTHGMGAKAIRTMLDNCPWAAVKHYEHGVILAESLTDKIGTYTDYFTKGIQGMDLMLNVAIWNACQCEVESKHKGDADFKFGTKQNMEEAAKLHAKVGQLTQGNSAKGELSGMQRSNSEIVKMLAQLNSDGFKMISAIVSGADRLLAYRDLRKQGVEISKEDNKSARNLLEKATTAFLASTLMYVLMGELINHMLDRDRDEDKDGNEMSMIEQISRHFGGAILNNIPIVKDIYSVVGEGYDFDMPALAGIEEFLGATSDVVDMVSKLASGETYDTKDIAAPLRSLANALGMVTGVPVKNINKYLYGFTKRFDESAAYEWDSVFYTKSYSADLKRAIDDEDEDLQTTIVGLMLKDDGLTDTSAKVNETLRKLYSEGYSVLPRSVSDSFSFDGEVYKMTAKQQKAFKGVYAKANDDVEDLINNKSLAALTPDVQAKAIKWIYDYYYEQAVYSVVGEEPDSKKLLFGETMDISKFSMTIAACNSVESLLDKKGNVVPGSRKATILSILNKLSLSKAEKAIILAYLGYRVSDEETLIKSFIARIGLSKAQQKQFLAYCGLAA